MDRNKLLAIVIGGLAALGTVAFLAGNAQAATWHDYSGDIYPGHAYGLVVPANAKSYEITLASDDAAAAAHVAVFGPDGAKLGFYSLSKDLRSAAIVGPADGRHVIYVYDLTGGAALKLRVDSQTAPPADLQKIDLARNDITVGDSSSPQKFDKVFTTKLQAEPVFATLLYDGSVTNLDATVASTKGNAVTITHEDGTAFAPGVWSALSGTRTSAPENFVGNAYTITVHAEKFEGSMTLTTLGLDLKAPPVSDPTLAPPDPAKPPAPPAHPAKPAKAPPALPTGAVVIPVAKPTAFTAAKGALLLQDAAQAKAASKDEHASGSVYDTVSIYAPDDTLLKFVTLDSRHPNASVELPVAGEYVAYVQSSQGKGVLAHGADGNVLNGVRELPLRKESFTFDAHGASGQASTSHAVAFKTVPVALKLAIDSSDTALFGAASLHNENGVVAEAQSLAQVPGFDVITWSYQNPSNFASGAHSLDVSGIVEGKLTLTAISYVRADAAAATPASAKAAHPESGGLFGGELIPGLL